MSKVVIVQHPKWLIGKVMARKRRITRWDAMAGRIGVVSHHLLSLLDAIKLTFLHVFVCIMYASK